MDTTPPPAESEVKPWFPAAHYARRLTLLQRLTAEQELDALLLFMPESLTWASGYFTRGYPSFQFGVVPAAGRPILVCRDVEAYYAERTCPDWEHVYWSDGEEPEAILRRVLSCAAPRSTRFGLELKAWHLSAARWQAVQRALPDGDLRDVSAGVARLRWTKSAEEVALQRQAAGCAEAGMRAAADVVRAGVSEREMAAEVCAAMIRAGSDMPGPGVLASGERARHLHGGYSDRVFRAGDIVQFEPCPCVRHYHARFMRTFKIGPPSAEEQRLAEALTEIQDRAIAAIAPGVPARVPDGIYREGVIGRGLAERYTNKTFYSVGLLLYPNTGEGPEATPVSDWSFEPGMTFHTYLLVQGFGISETIHVTADGAERLTLYPRELIVAGA